MTEDHALSGAYAVDALDDTERARFEAHLRHCAECRDEVDGLREAAALLETETVEPPAALRDAVLAGIQGVRPLPPIVHQDDDRQGRDARDELSARRSRRTGTSLAARLPLLVAAAAVLIAGVAGIVLKPWADERDPNQPPKLTVAEQVLKDPDATWVEKDFPDGAHATIVRSLDVGRAVIRTEDMRGAPEGKDYQLWLQTPAGEMEPAGVMPDLRDATVVLKGDASRATAVGITVEPDGGSERPTSEPIAVFSLDS